MGPCSYDHRHTCRRVSEDPADLCRTCIRSGLLAAWGPASARVASFGGQARYSRFAATKLVSADLSAEAREAKAEGREGGSSQTILSKSLKLQIADFRFLIQNNLQSEFCNLQFQ